MGGNERERAMLLATRYKQLKNKSNRSAFIKWIQLNKKKRNEVKSAEDNSETHRNLRNTES